MAKLSKERWENVREQLVAGNFAGVFVTRTGKLALNSTGEELPAEIAAMCSADDREQAEIIDAIRQADADVESWRRHHRRTAIEAERAAVIEEFRYERVWRLADQNVEGSSTTRYTFAEIAAWLRRDGQNHAIITVVCEMPEREFVIDIADCMLEA